MASAVEASPKGYFSRMHDDPASEHRDYAKEQEARWRALLDARPTEEQLQPLGEPSLKAARVLGEAKLATKSVSGLAFFGQDGQLDPAVVRKANRELIEEKKRRQAARANELDASMGMPSKEQLDYPEAARTRPVAVKALQLLGDDLLAQEAMKQLPPNAPTPTFKAMKVFGSASDLAPLKARRILGSSDEDTEARALADKHWKEELARRADEFNKEIFSRRPSEALKSIPMDQGPLPAKALEFFGDEDLKTRSLRALKIRAPPKAIHILGEAGLAGSKAGIITGATVVEAPTTSKQRPMIAPLFNYRKLFRISVGGVEAS